MPQPLIGITVGTGNSHEANGTALRVRSTYPRAVAAARGVPLLIPLDIDENALRAIYERLDGIVLTGGGDIEPSRYGAEASPHTVGVDVGRDQIEIQLAQWAVEDDKPLLGICRGHQVLNVALGGTLIQDIQVEVSNSFQHDSPTDEWFTRLPHEAKVARGSKLHTALGLDGDRLAVNTMHHQAVASPASSLCVVASADDGVIEGIEHPERRFIVGVQWHPEALFSHHEPHRRLFEALIAAV
jgi:putative glutamine amidotransferase